MKKIVIYLNSLGRGGAEHVSIILSEYLVKNDVECILLTTTTKDNEYSVPTGVRRISLKNSKTYIKKIIEIRKILRKEKINKILIMDTPGCIYAIPATFGLKIKKIVSERNDPQHFAGKKIVKLMSRFLMKKADGFVFQTEEAKKYYFKMLKGKGTVIHNPIFSEHVPNRDISKLENRIVSVGRLVEQKNQKLLIEAFSKIQKEYPNYSLTIYGEGPLRTELNQCVEKLNLTNKISLPGNKENVMELIKNAKLFVLSSHYEGMPNALIEAMAIGIPSISTDCPSGGPRTLINHMENGILVPVNNLNSMIKSIKYCLDNEKEAKKIGDSAKKIRKKLDMNIICKQWYDYIKNI